MVQTVKIMEAVRLFVPALIGWALCGVMIAVGRVVTSLRQVSHYSRRFSSGEPTTVFVVSCGTMTAAATSLIVG